MLLKKTAEFIRSEFECFVRIGMDPGARNRVRKAIERLLITERRDASTLTICVEARDSNGTLREVWILETDSQQIARLHEFLRRFSVEDVRLIDSMLHR